MVKQHKQQDPWHQARSVALRLLARREHSRLELTLKLRQRGLTDEVIGPVLDEYETNGWLDDERFAEVFVRQRLDAAWGPLKILGELQQRGIHTTPASLDVMTEDEWVQRAVAVRARKYGLADISGDWPEKQRQARFLASRGFTGGQVERALERQASED